MRPHDSVIKRALAELRAEFDRRLAVLEGQRGTARLRAAIEARVQLHGKVKAGVIADDAAGHLHSRGRQRRREKLGRR